MRYFLSLNYFENILSSIILVKVLLIVYQIKITMPINSSNQNLVDLFDNIEKDTYLNEHSSFFRESVHTNIFL